MRNELFQSAVNPKKAATSRNHAGGRAYDPGPEHGLAQMSMTCTLADSFYTSSEQQLNEVIKLADQCSPEFIGKLAVYSREVGQMKDLPAVLVAYLAGHYEREVLDQVFGRVIDNGRMVRNFFQIIRSGRMGRRGLGSQPKRLLRGWFASQGAEGVFRNSTGSNPSMADVIRMARPVPLTAEEKYLYQYLLGKGEASGTAFALKKWSLGEGDMPRGLPFEFLAGAATSQAHWEDIAHNLSWNATLKNLNTFARHKVSASAWKAIAARLQQTPPKHVFPYSVMTAFKYTLANNDIPMYVKDAVQDALDNSLGNIPAIDGTVAVCVDTSGSMGSAVTGNRGSATGVTTCVEVASLIASAILRKNPSAKVIVFDTAAAVATLNPRDSVATNCRLLNRNGGGTDVSSALRLLNQQGLAPDLTLMVSDNESWFERRAQTYYGSAYRPGTTVAQQEWERIAGRNKSAKLVCLDIQANPTLQVQSSKRVLNLGGFSDAVFGLVNDFSKNLLDAATLVGKIKEVKLD